MSSFSQTITEYWIQQFTNCSKLIEQKEFAITLNSNLSKDRPLIFLESPEGRTQWSVSPEMAEELQLLQKTVVSDEEFRRRLQDCGVLLHGADYVFYFTEEQKNSLLTERVEGIRKLTDQDKESFHLFQSTASEQDLDDAFVEFDHWAVFGAFENNKITCSASLYPWGGVKIADLGVLTLEQYRGKGYARQLVRAICHFAIKNGYEPQYRCQIDNLPSVKLAQAAGLTLFGKWDVVTK